MTEPAPAPAPPPPTPPAPPPPQPVTTDTTTDTVGLTPPEEVELGDLIVNRDAALVTEGAVQMKVEPPHSGLTYGGLTVTTEFTTVPAGLVAAVTTAAAEAGVTLTQES